MTSLQPNYLNV